MFSICAGNIFIALNPARPRKTAAWLVPGRRHQVAVCRRTGGLGLLLGLFFALNCGLIRADVTNQPAPAVVNVVTNLLQLIQFSADADMHSHQVRLEATILCQGADQLILCDHSGTAVITIAPRAGSALAAGQIVSLEGACLAGRSQIVATTLAVDNDGAHSAITKSATVALPKGLTPIRLEWFNGEGTSVLRVEWAGPGLSRGVIPGDVFFHPTDSLAATDYEYQCGLEYASYEGRWFQLPDFSRLTVRGQGIATNFDLTVRPRDTQVGLVFNGFIDLPRDGVYTFWVTADDGCKLYIGHGATLLITPKGTNSLVAPLPLRAGQPDVAEWNNQWSETEGTVNYLATDANGTWLELEASTGRTQLRLPFRLEPFWQRYLLGGQVAVSGVCQTGRNVDGRLGFTLLVPDLKQIKCLAPAPEHWLDYPLMSIASLIATNGEKQLVPVAHVSGVVVSNLAGVTVVADRTGQLMVKTGLPAPAPGDEIEVLGQCCQTNGELTLENAFYRGAHPRPAGQLSPLYLLTQAAQVKRLSSSEADRGYPAKIQGTITACIEPGYVIQDDTWSVYFVLAGPAGRIRPKVGEFWEIEGTTEMRYAPVILARKRSCLGRGLLPAPIHPAWDELINGSTDTQFIELQGVVLSVQGNQVVLLTHDGKFNLDLFDLEPAELAGLENARIRLRGVVSPVRDSVLQIVPARLRLFSTSVNLVEPPAEPFSAPLKHVADLRLFDARANALQRVRVTGQLVHYEPGQYYLMDGTNGLSFIPRTTLSLAPGDLVEVEGFPDVWGLAPLLREAQVRCTGSAPLPAAPAWTDDLPPAKLHGTRVRIQATLTGVSADHRDSILSLQTERQGFVARLAQPQRLPALQPGSRLELTGVYVQPGGHQEPAGNIFELLLNSPADIQVLAQPSWWTARHALTVVSLLLLVILAILGWVTQLRRQVEERTGQLVVEIKSREQAERQRLLEEERARIAHDLHDDLGASLTQIRFLSAVKSGDPQVPEATRKHLAQVSEKSRQMVVSLDEIVWAVNPAHDSLKSLAAYLSHVAREFFADSEINCRLAIDQPQPDLPMNSEVRHNLYLVVREAFNNIARHSRATEVWLRIDWQAPRLQIIVQDNGCGFAPSPEGEGKDGLANMRRRLAKIGGQFECRSQVNAGTTYLITLLLPPN